MRWGAGKQLALLLVVAFAVRLTAVAWWQSHHPDGFVLGDSDSYFSLARTLAEGRPYQYGPAQVFRAGLSASLGAGVLARNAATRDPCRAN